MNFERIKADNRIFRGLPQQVWAAWLPHLEPVAWAEGEVVADGSQPASHVYFPAAGGVALQATGGSAVKLALVGREGAIGLKSPASGLGWPYTAVAETAGRGYRMEAHRLEAQMQASSQALILLLKYQHALTAQITQTTLCRHHHTLAQQFCRWLLLGVNWLETQERILPVNLADEFVGHRTEEVMQVVHSLQARSLIVCEWPRVIVLDGEGVAQHCCDCFEMIRREYQFL